MTSSSKDLASEAASSSPSLTHEEAFPITEPDKQTVGQFRKTKSMKLALKEDVEGDWLKTLAIDVSLNFVECSDFFCVWYCSRGSFYCFAFF